MSDIDISASILAAAIEFVRTRDLYAEAKARRNAFRCDEESSGDFTAGDPGQGPCYESEVPQEDWCEPCQQRQVEHQRVLELRGKARAALPKLQRAVRRLHLTH